MVSSRKPSPTSVKLPVASSRTWYSSYQQHSTLLKLLDKYLPSTLGYKRHVACFHIYFHSLIWCLAHNRCSVITRGRMPEWNQCFCSVGIYFQIRPPNRTRRFLPRGGTDILCHRSMRTIHWATSWAAAPSRQTETRLLGWKVISTSLAECTGRSKHSSQNSWKTLRT